MGFENTALSFTLIASLQGLPEGSRSFATLQSLGQSVLCVPDIVDDPIHALLKKLLATDDLVEFDSLSVQLRSMLHERIEQLRREAKSLKPTPQPERKGRPRNGSKKA